MSWAAKRRFLYLLGIIVFFGTIFGGPLAYKYFSIPPTCEDGIMNQEETAPDRGGPCPLVDERMLQPTGTLWTRSFRVRDGSYNAVAYVQNPNDRAGVRQAYYRFRLYDSENVLVAEREGQTYILPGGITPVFEGAISTGNRIAVRAFFDLADPLKWEHLVSPASVIAVGNKAMTDTDTTPRLGADITNTGVSPLLDIELSAVVFDTAGNAFAASATAVRRLAPGETAPVVFTWPDPFPLVVGRIDVTPMLAPVPPPKAQ